MALDTDELAPHPVKTAKLDLNPMSVDELNAYIVGLEAEISRAKAAISAKEAHKNAAAAFFKS